MWVFEQSTGKLYNPAGVCIGEGYSGFGSGVNNPEMQNVENVGPIPQGTWSIGAPFNSPHLGPYVMALDAMQGTVTFGRDAFRLHGDTLADVTQHIQAGSHGCLVFARAFRQQVWESGDHLLSVVAELGITNRQTPQQPAQTTPHTPNTPTQLTADDLNHQELDLTGQV